MRCPFKAQLLSEKINIAYEEILGAAAGIIAAYPEISAVHNWALR
jgi:hypothetical protein